MLGNHVEVAPEAASDWFLASSSKEEGKWQLLYDHWVTSVLLKHIGLESLVVELGQGVGGGSKVFYF